MLGFSATEIIGILLTTLLVWGFLQVMFDPWGGT